MCQNKRICTEELLQKHIKYSCRKVSVSLLIHTKQMLSIYECLRKLCFCEGFKNRLSITLPMTIFITSHSPLSVALRTSASLTLTAQSPLPVLYCTVLLSWGTQWPTNGCWDSRLQAQRLLSKERGVGWMEQTGWKWYVTTLWQCVPFLP